MKSRKVIYLKSKFYMERLVSYFNTLIEADKQNRQQHSNINKGEEPCV